MTEWSISADSVWHCVYQQQQQHNVTTMHHHNIRVTRVWWLNLINELATVSVIYVQENKYQNNHVKVMMRKILASFCGHIN